MDVTQETARGGGGPLPLTAFESMTDEEVVAAVLEGNLGAFEVLMRRHNARVYRAARAILRDEAEAEDVMQEAYVRAFEHLRDFEGRARFSTWLVRIAVHEALARVRKRRAFRALDPTTGEGLTNAEEEKHMRTPSHQDPEQQASDGEMRKLLEGAVESLSDDFRAVFVLRAVEGMSGGEVANVLGIPEDTVKTRLFRAKKHLQEHLLTSFEPALPQVFEFHLSRCDRVVAAVLRRIGVAS